MHTATVRKRRTVCSVVSYLATAVLLLAGCAQAEPSIVPLAESVGAASSETADPATESNLDSGRDPEPDAAPQAVEPDAAQPAVGLPAVGPAADDQIVVSSAQGGIYLLNPDDGSRVTLAADGEGIALHPVWRPDGRRVAWSLADDRGFSVMSSNIDGTEQRRAQSPFGGYFGSWDPTSATLGYLGPAAPGTGLVFDSGTGAAMPGVVDSDTFYFFSWSPDGRQWIVHAGSGFRIKGVDGSTTPLNLDGGRFRAPVWAPDGSIFVTLRSPAGNAIVQLELESQAATEIFVGGDETNFVLDPTGRFLAVQTTDVVAPSPDNDGLGEPGTVSARRLQPPATTGSVVIVEIATRQIIDVIETETGGLWWSPDGTKLAILGPHAPGTTLVDWTIWEDGTTFTTDPFRLTTLYTQAYVPFFDQFAQSVTPWSPDSTRFVYPAISTNDERGIFVQEARPGVPPILIADDGILAFWSPT